MAEDGRVDASAAGAQHSAPAVAQGTSAAAAVAKLSDNAAAAVKPDTAAATTTSDEGGPPKSLRGSKSSRQKKNAKWKQGWKDKRKEKRRKREERSAQGDGDDDNVGGGKNKKPKMLHWKKEYDEAKVSPHLGSFAHPSMRALFDVKVEGLPKEGDDAETAANAATNAADETNGSATKQPAEDAGEEKKVPKRKLAMLVSFLGSNYAGFQINDGTRTLQSELELGLYRAGLISGRNFGHPAKYSWSNSARTDKGVHAAAQVCSFKGEMIYHHDMGESNVQRQLDAMRERVNACLPEDIRVVDLERVTRTFCARTNRDRVRYQYMVPSYMLCPRDEVRRAFPVREESATNASGDDMTPMEASQIVESAIDAEALARARTALVGHRATPEQMERLRTGLKLFEGTHPFHNYTRRVGADDAHAARYILSFAPLDPILATGGVDDDGTPRQETQWIPLQVVGQSFLLNQIRKMVSAAVDYARGTASRDQIERSLSKECRMKVNVAPAQGLFLDRSYFELYNKHKIENAPKHGDSRDRDTLDWVEAEGKDVPPAVHRIEEFKNEKIIPHIVREEDKEGNFLKYMYGQDVLYPNRVYSSMGDADNG